MVDELRESVDAFLISSLIDEFLSAENRFIQRDWEPAELDGGQFAEVCARIWYAEDSGNTNRSKGLNECLRYIENDDVVHGVVPRSTALHISRVLRTVYKFRSQRGAVHISPDYGPNEMDSRLVVDLVRWLFAETLRYFWSGERERVAVAIREVIQFDVPAIGQFGDQLVVQRTDLTAREEIFLLLHYAGDEGMSRTDLGRHAMVAPPTVTRTLARLKSSSERKIIQLTNGNYRLTDLGLKFVRENLAPKLGVE